MAVAGATAVRAEDPGPISFASAWPSTVERHWIGPAYWANRLQDWRLRSGRLECVEGRDRFPMRTVFLLTRTARPESGGFAMTVRTGPIDPTFGGPAVPLAPGIRGFASPDCSGFAFSSGIFRG